MIIYWYFTGALAFAAPVDPATRAYDGPTVAEAAETVDIPAVPTVEVPAGPRPYWATLDEGGAFVGFTHAPVRPRVEERHPERGAPPRGLGLLISGLVLFAGVAGTFINDVIIFRTQNLEGCHPCVPWSLYAAPALLPAIPLTIVGGLRNNYYRRWKRGLTFAPRPTGFTMQF